MTIINVHSILQLESRYIICRIDIRRAKTYWSLFVYQKFHKIEINPPFSCESTIRPTSSIKTITTLHPHLQPPVIHHHLIKSTTLWHLSPTKLQDPSCHPLLCSHASPLDHPSAPLIPPPTPPTPPLPLLASIPSTPLHPSPHQRLETPEIF